MTDPTITDRRVDSFLCKKGVGLSDFIIIDGNRITKQQGDVYIYIYSIYIYSIYIYTYVYLHIVNIHIGDHTKILPTFLPPTFKCKIGPRTSGETHGT